MNSLNDSNSLLHLVCVKNSVLWDCNAGELKYFEISMSQ